jgi:hypothetical protein
MSGVRFVTAVLLALVPAPAFAQAAPPAETGTPRATIEISRSHDTYHYHFDNPSRFDTADNVPHFFEQDYHVDATWLRGSLRYRWAGRTWETEGGVAPSATGTGKDGNVIVYGTTAVTSALSWLVGQTVELGEKGGFRGRVGYQYRRDEAKYHDSYSVTTMTNPPSQTEFWNAGRETTVSQVHEIRFGVSRDVRSASGWHAKLVADLSPATLAHLTTLLPDKYPGKSIVFVAKAMALEASIVAGYGRGRTSWHAVLHYSGAWNYSSSNAFGRQGLQAGLFVRF